MFDEEQLVAYGADKLASAILVVMKEYPRTQKKFELFLSCFDSDPTKSCEMIPIIKKKIESVKNRHGIRYSNYTYDIAQIVGRINEVRFLIMEAVLPTSPDQAIKLLSDLLSIHESVIEPMVECFDINRAFNEAFADLALAYEQTTYSLNDVVDVVFNRLMSDAHAYYDGIVDDFERVLGRKGLKKLQKKLENSTDYGLSSVQDGLRSIADVVDDVDAYIKACYFKKKEGPDARMHLEIAKRLIKHGRSREAMQWLESANVSEWAADKKVKLKIQALDQCGDREAAQAERLNWFATHLCPVTYKEILQNAEVEFKESFKKTAFKKAFDCQNLCEALTFLKEANELEQAGKLVKLRINSLSEFDYLYFVIPIASALHEIDPLAATLLLRKFIDQSVQSRAEHLATCHILSFKITDWGTFQTHEQFLQEISVEVKSKTSFWDEYNSALNEQRTKKAKLSTEE